MSFSPGGSGYLLIAYPFGLIIVALWFRSIYDLWMALSSINWKAIPLDAIELGIDASDDPDSPETYTPKAEYCYTYRSRTISSSKLTYRPYGFYSYKRAKRAIDKLARNGKHYAWINPKDPTQSVLLTGPNLWSYLLPVFMGFAFSWVVRGVALHNSLVEA